MVDFAKLTRKAKVRHLDALARRYIRIRDGLKCLHCGTYYGMYYNGDEWQIPNGLQTCHIFSRTHYNTRWHSRNMLSLCHGHHRLFDRADEREFREEVLKKFGMDMDEYDSLLALSRKKFHGDYELERLQLQQLFESIDETMFYGN